MAVVIFGGCGFVGLNIAEALLRRGRAVVLADRIPLPNAARKALAPHPGALRVVATDITDPEAVGRALEPGAEAIEAVVLGAALTAGPAREAAEPDAILRVNLLAQVEVLRRAKAAGARRVLNLSSGSAYGDAPAPGGALAEDGGAEPATLYAVTKLASERVAARLGALWGLDVRSVRLSAVFGPWERDTGARDTLSPQFQILLAAERGEPALLPREGWRDWIYAPDVAEAVELLIDAPAPRHGLYNVTAPTAWPVLAWGRVLRGARPGFVCRLAEAGEAPTVSLHGDADRPNLDGTRLAEEFGFRAARGMEDSAARLGEWWREHGRELLEGA